MSALPRQIQLFDLRRNFDFRRKSQGTSASISSGVSSVGKKPPTPLQYPWMPKSQAEVGSLEAKKSEKGGSEESEGVVDELSGKEYDEKSGEDEDEEVDEEEAPENVDDQNSEDVGSKNSQDELDDEEDQSEASDVEENGITAKVQGESGESDSQADEAANGASEPSDAEEDDISDDGTHKDENTKEPGPPENAHDMTMGNMPDVDVPIDPTASTAPLSPAAPKGTPAEAIQQNTTSTETALKDTTADESTDAAAALNNEGAKVQAERWKLSPPRLSPPAVQLKQPGPPIDIDSLSDSDTDMPDLDALLSGTQPQPSRSQPSPPAPPASQFPLSQSQRPKPRPIRRPQPKSSQQTTFKDLSATPRMSVNKNKRKFQYEVIADQTPAPSQRTGKQAGVKQEDSALEFMPPPKRARKSPQPTPRSQELGPRKRARRHPVFWHLDGSVIIRIEDTMFKLHRSRLAKQSSYFADLFARSDQGDDDDDIDDGGGANGREKANGSGRGDACPTYTITVTAPLDFERLLVAMDEGMSYIINPPPFDTLASILRASTALNFSTLRTWATRTLEQMWPRELDALDSEVIPKAAATIMLAKKCGVPKVLKRAYYELLRTSAFGQAGFEDDEGTDDDDDEIQIVNEEGGFDSVFASERNKKAPKAPVSQLPHGELMRLVETRQHMLADWIAVAAAPEPIKCPAGPAKNGKPCVAADPVANDSKWSALVLRGQIFENFLYDPILGMDALIDIKWQKEGYCEACATARREAWERRQMKLWDNLDVWLELGRA